MHMCSCTCVIVNGEICVGVHVWLYMVKFAVEGGKCQLANLLQVHRYVCRCVCMSLCPCAPTREHVHVYMYVLPKHEKYEKI